MGVEGSIIIDTKINVEDAKKDFDKFLKLIQDGPKQIENAFLGVDKSISGVGDAANKSSGKIESLGKSSTTAGKEAKGSLDGAEKTFKNVGDTAVESSKKIEVIGSAASESGKQASASFNGADDSIKKIGGAAEQSAPKITAIGATSAAAGKQIEAAFDGASDDVKQIGDSAEQSANKAKMSMNEYAASVGKSVNQVKAEVQKLAAAYEKAGYDQSTALEKAYADLGIEAAKGTKKAKQELDGMGKKAGDVSDSMSSKFKAAFSKLGGLAASAGKAMVVGLGAAATALGGAGVYAVKLASDLSEVQNVVDTTFGKDANKINEWASQAATSFGMSELQAKQFTGTLGAMVKSMGLSESETYEMSTAMVGLAGDFASFYNLPTEEAFEKIRAGISGETEPLKQLGINMSVANLEAYALAQGINTSYNEMSQAEQATLRYNYLMSVSADAQGDFAKTSDGLANQIRILQLNVQDLAGAAGNELIPAAQGAAKMLNGMLGKLKTALSEGGIKGLVSAIGDVAGELVTYIADMAPDLIDAAVNLVQSFIGGIQKNLPKITAGVIKAVESLVSGILSMLPQLLDAGLQLIGQLVLGIGKALPNIIPAAVQAELSMVSTLYDNLPLILEAGMELLLGLVRGILNAVPVLISNIPKVINSMVNYFITALPMLVRTGVELIISLGSGLLLAIPQLIMMIPKVIESIVNAIFTTNWLEVGKQILIAIGQGIINGVKGLFGLITGESSKSADEAYVTTGEEWNAVGKNIGQSTADGINENGKLISGQLESVDYEMSSKGQETGQNYSSSVGAGITQGQPAIDSAMDNMETKTEDGGKKAGSAAVKGASSGISENLYLLNKSMDDVSSGIDKTVGRSFGNIEYAVSRVDHAFQLTSASAGTFSVDLGNSASGGMMTFKEKLDTLRTSFQGMTDAEKIANAEQIVGKGTAQDLVNVLGSTDGQYQVLMSTIQDYGGTVERRASSEWESNRATQELAKSTACLATTSDSTASAVSSAAQTMASNIQSSSRAGADSMATEAASGTQRATDAINSGGTQMSTSAKNVGDTSGKALGTGYTQGTTTSMQNGLQTISQTLDGTNSMMESKSREGGQRSMTGAADGVNSNAGRLANATDTAVKGAIGSAEGVASRESQKIGKATMESAGQGAKANKNSFLDVISSIFNEAAKKWSDLFKKISPQQPVSGGSSGKAKGYATGTSSAAPGWHPVAERGAEIIESRNGRLLVPDETLYRFSGGERVYTAAQTSAITRQLKSAVDTQNSRMSIQSAVGHSKTSEARATAITQPVSFTMEVGSIYDASEEKARGFGRTVSEVLQEEIDQKARVFK